MSANSLVSWRADAISLTSILTDLFLSARITSANVGIVSPAGDLYSCTSFQVSLFNGRVIPKTLRGELIEWSTTIWPSLVAWTSNSTATALVLSAASNPAKLFSIYGPRMPRWAITFKSFTPGSVQ